MSGFSDKDGRFELRGVPEGVPVEVVIAAPGYERWSSRETIAEGRGTRGGVPPAAALLQPVRGHRRGRARAHEMSPHHRQQGGDEQGARRPGRRPQGDRGPPRRRAHSPIGGGVLVIRGSKPATRSSTSTASLSRSCTTSAPLQHVNPDLLGGDRLHPGQLQRPLRRLTGGLVEVRTRKLRDELHGYANLNLLEAARWSRARSEVRGVRDRARGRRSYIDYILRAAVSEQRGPRLTAAPRYYDAQFRARLAATGQRPPASPSSRSPPTTRSA